MSVDKGLNWVKRTQGMGLSRTDRYENNIHYESSTGKVFMVQLLDERVYYTNNSLLNPITLSGNIKDDRGRALVGVVISAKNISTSSNTQGNYSVVVPSGWSGRIQPQLGQYEFGPASVSMANVQGSLANIDFIGSYVGNYFVSGYVRTVSGQPIPQVLVSGFSGSIYTNEFGYYSAQVPTGWKGTLAPAIAGYETNPVSIVLADVKSDLFNQNFTLRKSGVVYVIGKVLNENEDPFSNVTLHGFPETTRVDAMGSFHGEIPLGWSGTIVPESNGHKFIPDKIQVTNLQGDLVNQVFIAAKTPATEKYQLSGSVTDSSGSALSDVLITGFPTEVRTTSGGSYRVELPAGWTGVIEPVSDKYTFHPSSITITNLSSPLTNQNFTGTIVTGIGDEGPHFSIYPNPSPDGFIYLQAANHEWRCVQITNSTGQIVWQGHPSDSIFEGLQLPESGLYFVSWSDKTKNIKTVKVLVH